VQRLAVNGAGDALLMWARSNAAGYCARRFSASTGIWSDEHRIDVTQALATLSVDLAANGDAAAVWSQGGDGIAVTTQLARLRGTVWDAPVQIGGANAGAPGVAMTSDGGVLVHWQNPSRTVEAMWQPSGGSWTSPQLLGTNSGGFYLPRLIKRSDSHLQMIWWAEGSGLSSREFDTGTAIWGSSRPIVPARASSAANVAAAGGDSGSVVMWWAGKLSGSGSDFGFSTSNGGSDWSTSSAVLTPRPAIQNQAATFADSGSVAMDGNGDATILWREFIAPGQSGVLLRAARVPRVP
jgi:hypothetical protein